MHNVLVTGGAGFIGSNFIHHLLKSDDNVQVVNLDALTYAGNLDNLKDLASPERHTFVCGSICDRDLVRGIFNHHQIDTVVHFAAESHVDRSILGPLLFIETNITGTAVLLEAAREAWLIDKNVPLERAHFHHVSTDEVFGSLQPGDPAFTETTPYAPNSPYAASKAASDHLARAYFTTYGLPITITNCSNNYGPRQFPEKLIPLTILNALRGKTLPIYGDGQQVRDWLYVEDHCEAVSLILRNGSTGETYNLGGNNQPPNLEIVQTLCAILDEAVPASPYRPHAALIQFVTDRPGHDRRYAMDNRKITSELGWTPKHDLRAGLENTVKWFLEHLEETENVLSRDDYQAWLTANYSGRGDFPK